MPKRRRLLWLDAMRGYAILWVVGTHSFAGFPIGRSGFQSSYFGHFTSESFPTILAQTWLDYGFLGVNLFIILSTLSLTLAERPDESSRTWLVRRAWRLLPPYYLLLPLAWLWQCLEHPHDRAFSALSLLLHATLVHTLWERTYFDIVGAFWFVALIAQVYLLYALYRRYSAQIGTGVLVGCGVVIGLAARTVVNVTDYDLLRGSVFFYAIEAVAGIAVARALARAEQRGTMLPTYLSLAAIPGIFCLDNRLLWPAGAPLVTIGAFGVLWTLLAALEPTFIVTWLAKAGRYSYGIFLVNQWPVGPLVTRLLSLLAPAAWHATLRPIVSMALAVAVGVPIERLAYWVAERLRRRRPAVPPSETPEPA